MTGPFTIGNPYTSLPITLCSDYDLPVFPVSQDCVSYPQLHSQVSGLVILPYGATPPGDWTSIDDWTATIDNTDTSGTKARYLVGKGSFLLNQQVQATLSGGRLVENRERSYRLTFNVLNMDEGHYDFGRKLQNNVRSFSIWLETLGDRMIGGDIGIKPFYVNADFPFNGENGDRESMIVTMDFFLPNSRPQQ